MTSLKFIGDLSPAVGAALALLAACACWWLYRGETKSLPTFVRWLLPLPRWLAIALSVLILTGPVLQLRYQQGNPGKILILVDGSQSMLVSDKHAAELWKLQIARSLGWVQTLPEGGVSVELLSHPMRPAIERFDKTNRYARAIERLLSANNGLLESLRSQFEIRVARVDANGYQVLWESSLAARAELPRSVEAWTSSSPGRSTDIGSALQSLVAISATARIRSTGGEHSNAADSVVLLLTDGQNNSGPVPATVAAQLAAERHVVFAVGYGSDAEPVDVGINSIEHSERCFYTDAIRGELIIKDRSIGKEVTATIRHADKTVWEHQFITENSGARRIEFSFPCESIVDSVPNPSERGVNYTALPLSFDVTLSRSDDEVDLANNSSKFNVTAVTQRANVLILDGRSRWETRYLRNIFQRDPTWAVDCVLFEPDREMGELKRESTSEYLRVFPESREELLEYDLIVLGELPPDALNTKQQYWLREFVEVSGGGLIVVDGERGYLHSDSYLPIRSLIPVGGRKPLLQNSIPYRAMPTEAGSQLSALRISDANTNSSESYWRQLPELRFVSRVEALPGSDVLATATNETEVNPLFVTRQVGAGRVFYSATDQSWRWRYRIADAVHQRLWNQIARWVMRLPMAVHGEYVSLDSGRYRYSLGDFVEIRARLKNPDGAPVASQWVEAIVERDKRTVLRVPLLADPAIPGVFTGRAVDLPVGNYSVFVRAPGFSQEALGIHTQFIVAESDSAEMQHLARNKQLLQNVAEVAKGKYLDEEDSHKLLELLRPLSGGTIIDSEIPIWQSYWWFVPIVGLLTLEWCIRKRVGLL